jgi:hypothetical protein
MSCTLQKRKKIIFVQLWIQQLDFDPREVPEYITKRLEEKIAKCIT